MKSIPLLCCGLLHLLSCVASAQEVPNAPTGRIEQRYFADGPSAVVSTPEFACCDRSGYAYDVWYPGDLGADGTGAAIISWGNGTGANPQQYADLLSHLASWGFVVIASRDPNTGSGEEILDAVKFLLAANDDPQSAFYAKLQTDRVGVMGHSQGATGVLNALMKSGGAVRTAIPIELPAQRWCSDAISCTDARALSAGSVFYLNGSADTLISPSTQVAPWRIAGQQSNQGYYDASPRSVGKLFATLIGPNHNAVQGQPDCSGASAPCVNGVYGYLGYPTAWMMAQLRDDALASAAFARGGEIFRQDSNWQNQISNLSP